MEFNKLSSILAESGGNIFFECPACETPHGINCGKGSGPAWSWNGNVEKPTFHPSILVQCRRGVPEAAEDNVDQILRGEIVQRIYDHVCHSFVEDGNIRFLSDCTHELVSTTVQIPDWDTQIKPT